MPHAVVWHLWLVHLGAYFTEGSTSCLSDRARGLSANAGKKHGRQRTFASDGTGHNEARPRQTSLPQGSRVLSGDDDCYACQLKRCQYRKIENASEIGWSVRRWKVVVQGMSNLPDAADPTLVPQRPGPKTIHSQATLRSCIMQPRSCTRF